VRSGLPCRAKSGFQVEFRIAFQSTPSPFAMSVERQSCSSNADNFGGDQGDRIIAVRPILSLMETVHSGHRENQY
jgi:hypothetical protein